MAGRVGAALLGIRLGQLDILSPNCQACPSQPEYLHSLFEHS
jgi:hypothetical protein